MNHSVLLLLISLAGYAVSSFATPSIQVPAEQNDDEIAATPDVDVSERDEP